MAKGLTSGYIPLGGLMVSDQIASFFEQRNVPIGLTYSAHPVACAAALAVLKVYEEDQLIDRAREMGAYIDQQVATLSTKHPSIGDFRNTGMLGCIELVKNRQTREALVPWNAKPEQMKVTLDMAAKIRALGMFTFVRWNYIFIAPPLTISKSEIDEGMDIISQTVELADALYQD